MLGNHCIQKHISLFITHFVISVQQHQRSIIFHIICLSEELMCCHDILSCKISQQMQTASKFLKMQTHKANLTS